ncbi:hypothetical protein OC842_001566 [Tilletia horrida]|uniref:WD40 repeat-like protein n=1 Tax=Tilletia horrida TaxID=155126 RepID=A0AAN6GHI6_9BASI|nr:hypothetical protein OC842_001566 [Tilletia horrida]
MQSSDARNLFQTEASLAQGRARAAKAKRTASGAQYGRPIWLAGNDGTAKAGDKVRAGGASSGVALSADDAGDINGAIANQLADAALFGNGHGHGDEQPFVSLAGKDESAGAAFDGGKTRVLGALLDPTPDGGNAHLLTAESGALLRRLDLESGLAVQLFRGHTAPATALAVLNCGSPAAGGSRRRVLLSSGWDRSVRAWPLYDAVGQTQLPPRISPIFTHTEAASDFIKALLIVETAGHPVLLSGGSDRTLRTWSLLRLQEVILSLDDATWQNPLAAGEAVSSSLTTANAKAELDLLGTFGEHTRPITALAVLPKPPSQSDGSAPIVFSADSLGRVAQSELEIKASAGKSGGTTVRLRPTREIKGNEATITALNAGWVRVEVEQEDDSADDAAPPQFWEARLWTASRDRSAYAYTIVPAPGQGYQRRAAPPAKTTTSSSSRNSLQFGSQEPLWPERTVLHPDYVTAVLDLNMARRQQGDAGLSQACAADSLLLHASGDVAQVPSIVTACSDEELRLWTLSGRGGEVRAHDDDDEGRDTSAKVFDVHGNAALDPTRSTGARLKGQVEGHWHEISFVGAWWRQPPNSQVTADVSVSKSKGAWWIVSASYDGSVRRWSLEEFFQLASSSQLRPKAGQEGGLKATEPQVASPSSTSQGGAASKPTAPAGGGIQLTAEEEAELAELMDSDDE